MTYGVVYGLRDPLTGKLRYVGQTVLPLHRRLAAHCTPSSLSQVDHRANWIKSLVNQGLRPEIEGLASARSKEDLDELEIQVIAQARALGEKLTNLEPGGGTLSPEHYQRLGSQKRNVPRTPEVKAKISAAKKGKPSHMEGKTHSEEVRAKISESRKGITVGSEHPQYRHDITVDSILSLIGEGLNITQVAAYYKASRKSIVNRLKEAGLMGENKPKVKRVPWNQGKKHTQEHIQKQRTSRTGKCTGASHPGYRPELRDGRVVDLAKQGLNPTDISIQLETSRATVKRILKESFFEYETPPKPLSPPPPAWNKGKKLAPGSKQGNHRHDVSTDRIVSLLQNGMNPRQVSGVVGISHSSIFNRIKKAGYVWDRYSKKLMPLHCSRGQS
jgi:transposase-like protein